MNDISGWLRERKRKRKSESMSTMASTSSPCSCNRKKRHVTSSPSSSSSSCVPPSPSASKGLKLFPNVDTLPPSAFRKSITLHQFLPLSIPTSPPQPSSFFTFSSSPSKDPSLCHSSDYDQRFKRLIKNRESGARSRARKQAYTNELETKFALLIEENSRLRTQIQELELRIKSSASAKPYKMRNLYRTSTSPF